MTGLARANIIGRLVADPEMNHTKNGNPVANFRVAVNRAKGEREEATFLSVSAWGSLALRCSGELKKGMTVYIWGDLVGREYTDRDGKKRYALDVIAQHVQWHFDRAVA